MVMLVEGKGIAPEVHDTRRFSMIGPKDRKRRRDVWQIALEACEHDMCTAAGNTGRSVHAASPGALDTTRLGRGAARSSSSNTLASSCEKVDISAPCNLLFKCPKIAYIPHVL